MQPWERRLNDLWLILERCHDTYMEPELFRLNTNQFLQTSRTVTFIIQKNKDHLSGFDQWYQPIIAEWGRDKVMNWAKDSRNTIEKEGDLDLHSTLDLTLFWSYIMEQDVSISTGRTELLQAGTKRLIRLARKILPSGLINSSAVRIERKWVANTLPDWELLHAFNYIYATLHQVCMEFSLHVGRSFDVAVPNPTDLLPARETARMVRYLKLSDLEVHSQVTERVWFDRNKISEERLNIIEPLKCSMEKSETIDDVFDTLCNMASSTFEHDGCHVPMMFLYGDEMRPIDFLTMHFRDRVDKYIFWRSAAERMIATKSKLVVNIGEAWIRDHSKYSDSEGIDALPIIGERLVVTALDSSGHYRSASWDIIRENDESKPSLKKCDSGKQDNDAPFYYAPILHALGLPYSKQITEEWKPGV